MRLEGAIRRKRARPDDGSGRADVEMEVAARSPIRPVQNGGSSSSWEVRPEPSRRRNAEEQLGGDVVKTRVQDPQVLCVQQRRPQPREELEAAVDSICKHIKELGALHVAESDVGEIFLPGRSGKLGSAFSGLPGALVDLRYDGSCCRLVDRSAGRLSCRASRVADWIAAESKAFTLDQRRTRSASPGYQAPERWLRRLLMANRAWNTLSPLTSKGDLEHPYLEVSLDSFASEKWCSSWSRHCQRWATLKDVGACQRADEGSTSRRSSEGRRTISAQGQSPSCRDQQSPRQLDWSD